VKPNISRYCANSNLILPARAFIDGYCAADPTLLTDKPTLTAGLTPWVKSSASKNTWPSVIEITFVGI